MSNPENTIQKLIILNVITAVLLLSLLVWDQYPQRMYRGISRAMSPHVSDKPHSYLDNAAYLELTDYYTIYQGQKNIVMLGNSLTNRVNWDELLGRNDVANRGIGSDITEGYIYRINTVLSTKPKICFIEGGINDVWFNVPKDSIVQHLNTLVDTLQHNSIIPVLTTVTYVANTDEQSRKFNVKVQELNKEIVSLSRHRNVHLIDLNSLLSEGLFMKKEFATADGIHYTSKAYLLWKAAIVKVLAEEKL